MYPQYAGKRGFATLESLHRVPLTTICSPDLTHPKAVPRLHKEKVNVLTICASLGPGDGGMLLEVVDAAIETLQPGRLLCFHCQ